MDWQKWCSFCAKIESKECRLGTETKLSYEIHEHFHIFHPNEQVRLCPQCTKFLKDYKQFKERCDKVQSMFEIISYASPDNLDDRKFLHTLRADIGLDCNDDKANVIPIIVEPEEVKEEEPIGLKFAQVKYDPLDSEKVSYTSSVTSNIANSYESNDGILSNNDNKPLNHHSFDEEYSEKIVSLPENRKLRNRLVPKLELVDLMETKKEIKELFPPKKKYRRPKSSEGNECEMVVAKEVELKPNEIRIWKCFECDLMLENQQKYEKHMEKRHPDDKRIYKCSIETCSKGFEKLNVCKRHEKTHLPDEQKKIYPCPHCDQKFSQKPNMLSHIRCIHIKIKSYICDQCGKKFINNGGLKSHLISHVDEKTHVCEHCTSSFKTKSALKRHLDIHVNTHICSLCGLSLSTRDTLKKHMLTHSEIKKHECKFPNCGATFKTSKSLKVHLLHHSGLKPYTCWFCPYASNNKSNFNLHRNKRHAIEWAEWKASGRDIPKVNTPRLSELQFRGCT